MALSPLSKSSVPSPSLSRTTATERPPSPLMRPSPVTADAAKVPSLQGLLQQDGFDSVAGTGKGGMEKLGQMLAMQVLGELAKLLGGEGVGGAQQGGVAGLDPSAGVQDGGVPDLGGEEQFADGAEQAGAPQLPPRQNAAVDAGPANLPQQARNTTPPQDEPPVAKAQGASQPQGAVKGKNTLTLNNDGTTPMTVNFTPNAGEKAVDPVTLKPGESRTVQFPDGWSGNFRSASGDGKNATLGEVKFNGGMGQTYYDVSYIEGHNAAMTMQPVGGGRLSGTTDNLLASAPDSVKAKGADGQAYGIKKSTTANVQDPEVVDFFRKHVGADQGYVIPTDDASTLGSSDSNLVVHMKNLA
ncbi:hypothetical protein [Corallococcus llansteffanensis]|uniref:Uncharacterized protein n=1 Tax=Corallococcus llansteffanensis TaxID=2316731 RepID=A0A3A8NQ98_9BACT|nr:hypothetical protein [Corallococcus llansteffanensis]RKH43315.1 hypothetical protein D7V93_37135 [Corallococcus llansteffanensis]